MILTDQDRRQVRGYVKKWKQLRSSRAVIGDVESLVVAQDNWAAVKLAKRKLGSHKRYVRQPFSARKLTSEEVMLIRTDYQYGMTAREVARKHAISERTVNNITSGRSFPDLPVLMRVHAKKRTQELQVVSPEVSTS
jgi:DNA-binding NarL/FixJ family response regulator